MVRRLLMLAAALVLGAGSAVVHAASWDAELQDGRQISVDPATNRPLIQSGSGSGTPLWDGVHRLSDGSVITVRSGVMVPNEEVLSLRRGEPAEPERPAEAGSVSCDALTLRVCGLHGECGASEACELARQLRTMRAHAGSEWAEDRNWAETRCEQALAAPEAFPVCAAAAETDRPCEQLVEHVCGQAQRCAASRACNLAQQLLELELEASSQGVEEHAAQTRQQCQQMLGEHAFFPPCR